MQVIKRLAWAHSSSSISKTVLLTVNLGPSEEDRTSVWCAVPGLTARLSTRLKHYTGRARQRASIVYDLSQDGREIKAPDDAVAGVAQPREASPQRLVLLVNLSGSFIGKSRLRTTATIKG